MVAARQIFCCGCERDVSARLTDGCEIYPHRPDLSDLPFWRCDGCGSYVGCHHQTKDRTRPLGVIPTRALMKARGHIHAILDPLWKNGNMKRGKVYRDLAARLGIKEYHTAEIRSIEEARRVYRAIQEMARGR